MISATANRDTDHGLSQRLLAVMEFDAVPQDQRIPHLARKCGVGWATARRLLSGFACPRFGTLRKVAIGLDVHVCFLINGEPSPHGRTMRIYVQQIKGYDAEDAGRIVQVFAGGMMGNRRATNLMNRAGAGEITWPEAGWLLQNFRHGPQVPVRMEAQHRGSVIQFPGVAKETTA